MKPVAVGDIHGRLDLLDALIARFPGRTFVFLGDYVDRGPESRGCIQRVRELVEAGRAVACMGNHDLFLIETVLNDADDVIWLMNGGDTTVNNYGEDWAAITADALWLQENLKQWHVADGVLFAHAMRPHEGDPDAHLWGRPQDTPVYPLPEGVTVSVHGHTPMESCPLPVGLNDGTRLWFIDTGAVWTGKLCALDCETMQPTIVEVTP